MSRAEFDAGHEVKWAKAKYPYRDEPMSGMPQPSRFVSEHGDVVETNTLGEWNIALHGNEAAHDTVGKLRWAKDDVAAYHANSCEHCANGTEHPQMDPDPRNFSTFDPNNKKRGR